MDLRSYKKTLTEIYLVSNTPAYLFETMKNSVVVRDYLSQLPTKELIGEFENRLQIPIADASEIAELYAVLVALSFKDYNEVAGFFQYVRETIKFEWFATIADYYLKTPQTNSNSSFFMKADNVPNVGNHGTTFKVVL